MNETTREVVQNAGAAIELTELPSQRLEMTVVERNGRGRATAIASINLAVTEIGVFRQALADAEKRLLADGNAAPVAISRSRPAPSRSRARPSA